MKTLPFIFSLLTITALISACESKKAMQEDTSQPSGTEKPAPEDPATVQKEIYQVAGYQKTACYGKCPVFQVKFYSDGNVSWNGKMNVERLGMYEAQVSDEVLKGIRNKAFEIGFFDLNNEYPLKDKVVDLPATVSYIRVGDMEKTIRNSSDAPESLKIFEQYMESVINACNWREKND